MAKLLAVAALLAVVPAAGLKAHSGDTSVSTAAANPVRKVVTMLQAMQNKVTEEGKKQQDLYDKFMCYCKNGAGTLSASISDANTKVPQLGSDIESSTQQKAQAEEDLKQAQVDREAAKAAMAEATTLREKEAAAYATTKADYDANIAALGKAITAVDKGASGSFVQTDAAQTLKKIAMNSQNMLDADRQELVSFLSGGAEYAPQSGEISGILKTLKDEMSKSLAEATTSEEASLKSFDELMAAKTKEVEALISKVEAKTALIGELGVSIAQMKNELTDTEEALIADQKFLAEMDTACKTKTAEWEEIKKTRADELVALADTIKILNDDDALDLFKKTLPSASSSFVQVKVSGASIRAKALAALQTPKRSTHLDFISLALHNKKIGFEKVVKMIDELVGTLKKEQLDDNHKKEYCATQLDMAEDKAKALQQKLSDIETALATTKESIETLTSEIAGLEEGIKALDKQVGEATEQRKEENADYKELMASNGAAKELLNFAKNRLNKFYNPKLYKPPAKAELSESDKIASNFASFVQLASRVLGRGTAAPAPPPETFGAYTKKSEEGGGVIAMIDLLVKDLDKEMTEAEAEEKNAAADYEASMQDSAEKRVTDSTLLAEKGVAKANAEGALQDAKDGKIATGKELMATGEYIGSLHGECDWLLQNFDVRKTAREGEIEALGKAKAVLSGADFSLLQTFTGMLRGSH
jgi:DNA repair exonuclease SbcCD ATPase subunit